MSLYMYPLSISVTLPAPIVDMPIIPLVGKMNYLGTYTATPGNYDSWFYVDHYTGINTDQGWLPGTAVALDLETETVVDIYQRPQILLGTGEEIEHVVFLAVDGDYALCRTPVGVVILPVRTGNELITSTTWGANALSAGSGFSIVPFPYNPNDDAGTLFLTLSQKRFVVFEENWEYEYTAIDFKVISYQNSFTISVIPISINLADIGWATYHIGSIGVTSVAFSEPHSEFSFTVTIIPETYNFADNITLIITLSAIDYSIMRIVNLANPVSATDYSALIGLTYSEMNYVYNGSALGNYGARIAEGSFNQYSTQGVLGWTNFFGVDHYGTRTIVSNEVVYSDVIPAETNIDAELVTNKLLSLGYTNPVFTSWGVPGLFIS